MSHPLTIEVDLETHTYYLNIKYWLDLDHPKNLKARPVNPMHKHPMKKLFNAVGRAWMFTIRHWNEEHCILHRHRTASAGDVKRCN